MTLQDCIKFANENPICYVATMDGEQPRVRAFMLFFANEDGFYLGTISTKSVSKQLRKNPKIELCFYNNVEMPQGFMDMKMMRVAGEAEFLDDLALKKRMLQERAFLKDMGIDKPEDPRIEVLRIAKGEAHLWTMMDNMKESEIERVKF